MQFDSQILQLFIFIFIPTTIFIGFLSTTKEFYKLANVSFFLVFILICLLLLLRKVDAGTDFQSYAAMYNKIYNFGDIFTQYHGNVFFSFIMFLGKLFNLKVQTFFIAYGILVLTIYSLSCRLFLPTHYATLALAFFGLTSSFIFYSTNIIRQGLGCTLFILAIGLWCKNKKKTAIFVQILSFYSHTSVIFLIIAQMFNRIFKSKKIVLLLTMPLMPLLGFILLRIFSEFGGLFKKIDRFSSMGYDNKLVYVKIGLLYGIGFLVNNVINKIKNNADHYYYAIDHLFSIYLLILSVCFLTLPVLLLSSRLVYYPSTLLPIFFSYIVMHLRDKYRLAFTFFWIWLFFAYGIFVYSFGSTSKQIGL